VSASPYVANSSPFIVFERVGQRDLLRALMGHLCIPPAVRREVFGSKQLPDWIEERTLSQPLLPHIASARLGTEVNAKPSR
jgi:predicted nucleic acid-binding protein